MKTLRYLVLCEAFVAIVFFAVGASVFAEGSNDTISSIHGTPSKKTTKVTSRHYISHHPVKSHALAHTLKPLIVVVKRHKLHGIAHTKIVSSTVRHSIQKPTILGQPKSQLIVTSSPIPIPLQTKQAIPISTDIVRQGPIYLEDDFSNPSRTEKLWDVLSDGGTLKFGRGRISLKDNTADFAVWHGQKPAFPRLRLKLNPFPTVGDWRCSFIYSFNKGGGQQNSAGISVYRADHSRLMYLQKDGAGQTLALNDKVVWSATQQFNKHEVSIKKLGNTIYASVDGMEVAQEVMGNSPTAIELGGTYQNQTNWSNFDLDYLRMDDGSLPEPINGSNGQTPISHLVGSTIIFSDAFQTAEQSRKNWLVNENGGSVTFQQGSLCLKDDPPDYDAKLAALGKHYDQSGFPQVKLGENPFPVHRNWTLQFSCSFTKFGPPNPDGILVLRADGSPLLAVGQDAVGEFALLNNKGVWSAAGNSDSHTVVLKDQDDRVTVSIDGRLCGQDYALQTPTTVQLGGSLTHNSKGWNNFNLLSISLTEE